MQEAHARHTDPSTSHQAAAAVTPEITKLQQTVLGFAKRMGMAGFTDLVMEDTLGDHGSTYRTRRRELVEKGLIVDTGRRDRRPEDRRSRIIWAVKRP